MTRARFVTALRKAAAKARLCDYRIIVTDVEEGVAGTLGGVPVRITADVVDGPAMGLRRQQLLEQIRSRGARQERAA